MKLLRLTAFGCLALIVLLGATSTTGVAEEEDKRNFAQKALAGLTIGQPVVTDQLFVFPLIAPDVPAALAVTAEPLVDTVDFEEPEFSRRRYDVLVRNRGDVPALVLGGVVLDGGKRDRLIRRSILVGANTEVEAAALPASASSDVRADAEPFGVAEALAPTFLRRKSLFGGSALTVTTFIARWLDFREEGDERKSLVAIAESSKLKQFCLPCHEQMSSLPQPSTEEGRIVGAIGGVRGRIQGLVLFGSNQLFQAYFEAFLKGATYPSAAIEIQAKKAGLKLPGDEDPEKTLARLTKDATELLQNMQRATYRKDRKEEGEVGKALLFRTPKGNRGRALGMDDQMVYLAAFVHDPFENAFYGTALEVPNPEDLEDPTRPGVAELARRGRNPGQRLTEFEKRLLERLRKAPGASGRAPGAPVPGPRVPSGAGSGAGGAGRRR